ncbi:MAG: hypothetical protein IPK13_15250 [Deltaproteobacteria bacterium]|nr:hypothetical protein [Deltaproteobacteria bacterium]
MGDSENHPATNVRAPLLSALYQALDAFADRTLPGRRPDGSALAARCLAAASFEIPKVASTVTGDTGDQTPEGHTGTTEDLPQGAILGAGSEDLAPEAPPDFLPDFLTAPAAPTANATADATANAMATGAAASSNPMPPAEGIHPSEGQVEGEGRRRPAPHAEPSLEELLFSDVSPNPHARE